MIPDEWVRCPECGSDDASVSTSYGDARGDAVMRSLDSISLHCPDCGYSEWV